LYLSPSGPISRPVLSELWVRMIGPEPERSTGFSLLLGGASMLGLKSGCFSVTGEVASSEGAGVIVVASGVGALTDLVEKAGVPPCSNIVVHARHE